MLLFFLCSWDGGLSRAEECFAFGHLGLRSFACCGGAEQVLPYDAGRALRRGSALRHARRFGEAGLAISVVRGSFYVHSL